MGLLTVKGTLDIGQFWPNGSSDADTAHVVVDTGPNAFTFREKSPGPAKATSVFGNAIVKGQGSKPAIDKKGAITVRFQGIDAPELHYRPAPLGKLGTDSQKAKFKTFNHDYRQYFGESAAEALGAYVSRIAKGKTTIPCTVTTNVEHPNDVFDTYGRFIGDINVVSGGKTISLNRMLVEQGWAFPTFYTSMQEEEIQAYLDAWSKGKAVSGRLGKLYEAKIAPFKKTLVFRNKGVPDPAKDKGPVNMPKLFRRQTTWWAQSQAGIYKKSYAEYLAEGKDQFLKTSEFLKQGIHSAPTYNLGDYIKGSTFQLDPWEMVFKESPSVLVDSKGKKIVSW